jgi:hypothetical protein
MSPASDLGRFRSRTQAGGPFTATGAGSPPWGGRCRKGGGPAPAVWTLLHRRMSAVRYTASRREKGRGSHDPRPMLQPKVSSSAAAACRSTFWVLSDGAT